MPLRRFALNDLVRDLNQVFSDRLKNRFLATYSISWLVYNLRKLLVLVFGSGEFEGRLTSFEAKVSVADFVIPVLIGIGYLLVGPWISLGVDFLQHRPLEKRRDWRAAAKERDLKRQKRYAEAKLRMTEAELTRKIKDDCFSLVDQRMRSTISQQASELDANLQDWFTEKLADDKVIEHVTSVLNSLVSDRIEQVEKQTKRVCDDGVKAFRGRVQEVAFKKELYHTQIGELIEWALAFADDRSMSEPFSQTQFWNDMIQRCRAVIGHGDAGITSLAGKYDLQFAVGLQMISLKLALARTALTEVQKREFLELASDAERRGLRKSAVVLAVDISTIESDT